MTDSIVYYRVISYGHCTLYYPIHQNDIDIFSTLGNRKLSLSNFRYITWCHKSTFSLKVNFNEQLVAITTNTEQQLVFSPCNRVLVSLDMFINSNKYSRYLTACIIFTLKYLLLYLRRFVELYLFMELEDLGAKHPSFQLL